MQILNYYYCTRGKLLAAQKEYKLFGTAPTLADRYQRNSRSADQKIKLCTTTETRNKNKDARTYPVVSTNRQLPNSLEN